MSLSGFTFYDQEGNRLLEVGKTLEDETLNKTVIKLGED
jgi:hypothetical protein